MTSRWPCPLIIMSGTLNIPNIPCVMFLFFWAVFHPTHLRVRLPNTTSSFLNLFQIFQIKFSKFFKLNFSNFSNVRQTNVLKATKALCQDLIQYYESCRLCRYFFKLQFCRRGINVKNFQTKLSIKFQTKLSKLPKVGWRLLRVDIFSIEIWQLFYLF